MPPVVTLRPVAVSVHQIWMTSALSQPVDSMCIMTEAVAPVVPVRST